MYCPTFRKEPTGQVWCADVIGAGRKKLILVALLDENLRWLWAAVLKRVLSWIDAIELGSWFQLHLLVVCACSLTACEPMSLLVGRSFETLTAPNFKFPNYDSACELSFSHSGNQLPGYLLMTWTLDLPQTTAAANQYRAKRMISHLHEVHKHHAALPL